MKFSVVLLGLVAAVAAVGQVDAAAQSTVHIRIHHAHKEEHHDKGNAICYKQCPKGQYCARGTTTCRAPAPKSTECFNPATSYWIPKCDPGFVCRNGKCDYANLKEVERYDAGLGAICYKQCPKGQHCARGTTTCRAPAPKSTECFNPATALWIPKCDPGFVCREGKCDLPKKTVKAEKVNAAAGAICYKQCPKGQYCARGTTTCRKPNPKSTECFNPATALWIPKCDTGFVCRDGKCDYKK